MTRRTILFTLVLSLAYLQGCAAMVLGTAAGVAIEVAKVPFKVGGAVVDVATGDDD